MILSRRKKFVFVGIQKTATTSIEQILSQYESRFLRYYYRRKHARVNRADGRGYKHLPAEMAQRLIGQRTWRDYYTFTFIRNPWARTFSEFTGHRHQPEFSAYKKMETIPAFRAWIKDGGNWLVNENTMYKFISDSDNQPIVDFIGRFEQMDSDWQEISRALQLPYHALPALNKSKSSIPIREAYDQETASIVFEWIKDDISYFDYPDSPFT